VSKWRRLQRRSLGERDGDFRGTMSESYLCIDCGFDTHPGNLNRAEAEQEAARQVAAGKRNWALPVRIDSRSETYIVHDHVWKAAGMAPWGGCLCIGCLEKRIGRQLKPMDFADHVFNDHYPGTPRLLERQGRAYADPLGEQPSADDTALDHALGELIGTAYRRSVA
jgi:hypothetical protein